MPRWLCNRIGPRLAYTWLLIVGSLPVMGIGLAQDFQTFLVFRLLIGVIGASFVITQYHTTVMLAPNVVGTANATTAGWGNLGGGVTQLVMPIVLGVLTVGAFVPFTDVRFLPGLGLSDEAGWRVAIVLAGAMCALVGVAYYFLTQDAPGGELSGAARGGQAGPQAEREGLVRHGGERPPGLGAVRHLRRVLRHRADGQQRPRPLLIDYFDFFSSMTAVQAVQWAGAAAMLFGLMNARSPNTPPRVRQPVRAHLRIVGRAAPRREA